MAAEREQALEEGRQLGLREAVKALYTEAERNRNEGRRNKAAVFAEAGCWLEMEVWHGRR
ncbi:MAG TPA: hypothetical protein VJ140_10200 [Actinomycetota bacterium]|nr:hypothetical protein [Actinomycetota bacterium]